MRMRIERALGLFPLDCALQIERIRNALRPSGSEFQVRARFTRHYLSIRLVSRVELKNKFFLEEELFFKLLAGTRLWGLPALSAVAPDGTPPLG